MLINKAINFHYGKCIPPLAPMRRVREPFGSVILTLLNEGDGQEAWLYVKFLTNISGLPAIVLLGR